VRPGGGGNQLAVPREALGGPHPSLLSWEATPPHARQTLVLHGYRPVSSRLDVPGALLTLHNETANTWSHLAALGWMVHRSWVTAMDETASADARLYTQIFHGCAAFAFCASALCHAFGPVLPPASSAALWWWDLFGICVVAMSSFAPGLRFAFCCHQDWLRTYSALVACLGTASLASLALWRRETTGATVPPPSTSPVPPAFVASVAATGAFAFLPLLHWSTSLATPADRALLLPSLLGVLACYAVGQGCLLEAHPTRAPAARVLRLLWQPLRMASRRLGGSGAHGPGVPAGRQPTVGR